MRINYAQRKCVVTTSGNAVKKATNVSIRSDLLADARELKINLSAEFEKHLAEIVRKARGEQWKRENREAIEAYNRHVEKHGVWSDGLRGW
ncbi:MAG: type II toxin-antitoxin system CcdA family antitoxin [Proteobacteria bacterium]|uniref:type II toxin-antitoxin system CcdA family antitoxin n=1 Tax=Rudaea sp. TaxID=2136325 RepID=UPI00321FA486|nr:type II toxin-antitoxin system CcdA family antitoxin [Pseudomonadota bacterium]